METHANATRITTTTIKERKRTPTRERKGVETHANARVSSDRASFSGFSSSFPAELGLYLLSHILPPLRPPFNCIPNDNLELGSGRTKIESERKRSTTIGRGVTAKSQREPSLCRKTEEVEGTQRHYSPYFLYLFSMSLSLSFPSSRPFPYHMYWSETTIVGSLQALGAKKILLTLQPPPPGPHSNRRAPPFPHQNAGKQSHPPSCPSSRCT